MQKPLLDLTPADFLFQTLINSKNFSDDDYVIYTEKEELSTVIQIKSTRIKLFQSIEKTLAE